MIDRLDTNRANGFDAINAYVLKKCSPQIATPIDFLFRRSINDAKLPDSWKLANVTPIFKKGSKTIPSNYRPISLTSVLCKMLEKIIKLAILSHLYTHNLISPAQHGFVHKKACVSNLLVASDLISHSLAKGLAVDVVFLDFAKAFDKVSHQLLMLKLEKYGISGRLLDWLKNFLFMRKQRVVLGDSFSDWTEVVSGVPQGSVLGPLLFIIFINDMQTSIRSKLLLYFDDSKLISVIRKRPGKHLHAT